MTILPPPRFAHDGNHGAVHIDHAEEVRVKKALRVLGLCEFDRAGDAEARVVDEHVYSALTVDYLIDGILHRRLVRDIGDKVIQSLDSLRPAAQFINGISRVPERKRRLHTYARCSACQDRYFFIHKKPPPNLVTDRLYHNPLPDSMRTQNAEFFLTKQKIT